MRGSKGLLYWVGSLPESFLSKAGTISQTPEFSGSECFSDIIIEALYVNYAYNLYIS